MRYTRSAADNDSEAGPVKVNRSDLEDQLLCDASIAGLVRQARSSVSDLGRRTDPELSEQTGALL